MSLRPILLDGTGERRLFLAVLEDALARLAGANPEGASAAALAGQRQDARDWFRSRAPGAFTFEGVCEALGIAAGPLRRAALEARSLRRYPIAHIARRVEKRPRVGRGR